MKLALVDFETNGVDNLARPTEFGVSLIDSETYKSFFTMGELIYDTDYPPQSEIILKITGITDEMLKRDGIPFHVQLAALIECFYSFGWPDFFVAHNASFDARIFRNEMKRCKPILLQMHKVEVLEKLFDIPWICSINDIDHPKEFKCKKLSHLALDYGIAVDPTTLHRATDDVDLLAKLLEVAKIDWTRVVARQSMPWVYVRAVVPHPKEDNGAGKDKASSLGFKWQKIDDQHFDKWWVKKVKEPDIPELERELGYATVIVGRP
jgi:DNA polymerase III epsilon subunit-like protein